MSSNIAVVQCLLPDEGFVARRIPLQRSRSWVDPAASLIVNPVHSTMSDIKYRRSTLQSWNREWEQMSQSKTTDTANWHMKCCSGQPNTSFPWMAWVFHDGIKEQSTNAWRARDDNNKQQCADILDPTYPTHQLLSTSATTSDLGNQHATSILHPHRRQTDYQNSLRRPRVPMLSSCCLELSEHQYFVL